MENINIIAKEGFFPIGVVLGLAVFFDFIFGFDFMANLLYILTIALIFIYRNPERSVHSNHNEFLSPIDGRIDSIDIKDGKQYVQIDVSICNIHLLRSPIESDMKVTSLVKGLNLPSYKYKAKKLNERVTLEFGKLKINLLSGFFSSQLDYKDTTSLSKGDRVGVFLNGIITMELSKDEKLFVNIGDKVYAGETVLGAFKN